MDDSTGGESELPDSRGPVSPVSADTQPSSRHGALTELAYWGPIVGFDRLRLPMVLGGDRRPYGLPEKFELVRLVGHWPHEDSLNTSMRES